MKWIAKALVQKTFSALPNGERLNFWFQKRAGGLPVSRSEFLEKVGYANDRIRCWEQFGAAPLSEIQCFEFGAGWDLIGPLSYWSFGVDRQIVIDIRPNLHFELVQDAIDKFRALHSECEKATGRIMRPMPAVTIRSVEDLREQFGIDYRAPLDAAGTHLAADSIDFISTNSTLEHIPESSLLPIMRESHRILSHRGLACHFIDMKDHFSYFDHSITKYNFLKFSDLTWSLLNSNLSYQNRLRYADYQRIFQDAGLNVVWEHLRPASPADLTDLKHIDLARRFKGTNNDEHLGAHVLGIVLKK